MKNGLNFDEKVVKNSSKSDKNDQKNDEKEQKNDQISSKTQQKNNENSNNFNNLSHFIEEVKDIKNQIEFGSERVDDGIKIFGELLAQIRESREMSLLMLCRHITQIKIIGTEAEIDASVEVSKQLSQNESYFNVLKNFFKSRGLGFRFKQAVAVESDLDKLKFLLGGKLEIRWKSFEK